MTPEGKIKKLVSDWHKKNDIYMVSIIPSPMGRSVGVADKIGILNDGTFLAIEVKSEGKRKNVTANQKLFLDTINERGGIAVVVSCQEDLDELDAIIAARKHVVMYDN